MKVLAELRKLKEITLSEVKITSFSMMTVNTTLQFKSADGSETAQIHWKKTENVALIKMRAEFNIKSFEMNNDDYTGTCGPIKLEGLLEAALYAFESIAAQDNKPDIEIHGSTGTRIDIKKFKG